jgi:hypothetical protein
MKRTDYHQKDVTPAPIWRAGGVSPLVAPSVPGAPNVGENQPQANSQKSDPSDTCTNQGAYAPRSPEEFKIRSVRRHRRLEDRLVRMQQDFRKGATLTEVLIALLIMSIGLVALAVLFPISVLRSIKATQFTTATDNRYNAEAMIALFPNMIRNPDYQIDPVTLKIAANTWNNSNFIVDPLGYAKNGGSGNNFSNYFGNNPNLPNPGPLTAAPVAGSWQALRRFPGPGGAATTESTADYLVTMPDSWVLQYQGFMTAGSAVPAAGTTQIDVGGLSATLFALTAGIQARAVIFSVDGLSSQTRYLTQVTGNTIQWSENANGVDANGDGTFEDYPLPTSFTPGGKVRIELQERRYSWLLTVRKDTLGGASVDVVVFFKRKFDINTDEYLFPATFTSGSNQVVVQYPLGINPATNQEYKPFMHKGNYIFDANNAFWYRVSNVNDNGKGTAQITLDVPANATSPAAAAGVGPYAMFPRNIVDVYPLGGK